jgi:hypothetical protein
MGALAGFCVLALACGRVSTQVGAEGDGPCEPVLVYVDAASGTLSGGFTLQSDPDAGVSEYLSPPAGVESLLVPGEAGAQYAFSLSCPGTYLLWGRMHGPDPEHNTFWLSVDGEPFYQWRLSTGVVWFWRPVTRGVEYLDPIQYVLDAGSHQLVVRNSASGDGVAGFFIALPGEVPPGNDTPCKPPDSVQMEDGGCVPSCGSHGANTVCGAGACAGQAPLVAYDCVICCFVADGGADSGTDGAVDSGADGGADSGVNGSSDGGRPDSAADATVDSARD